MHLRPIYYVTTYNTYRMLQTTLFGIMYTYILVHVQIKRVHYPKRSEIEPSNFLFVGICLTSDHLRPIYFATMLTSSTIPTRLTLSFFSLFVVWLLQLSFLLLLFLSKQACHSRFLKTRLTWTPMGSLQPNRSTRQCSVHSGLRGVKCRRPRPGNSRSWQKFAHDLRSDFRPKSGPAYYPGCFSLGQSKIKSLDVDKSFTQQSISLRDENKTRKHVTLSGNLVSSSAHGHAVTCFSLCDTRLLKQLQHSVE